LKRVRIVMLLALGLFMSPLTGPAQAAPSDSSSGAAEVRLPVTPPPKDLKATMTQVRQVRMDISTVIGPPARRNFSKGVEIRQVKRRAPGL